MEATSHHLAISSPFSARTFGKTETLERSASCGLPSGSYVRGYAQTAGRNLAASSRQRRAQKRLRRILSELFLQERGDSRHSSFRDQDSRNPWFRACRL